MSTSPVVAEALQSIAVAATKILAGRPKAPEDVRAIILARRDGIDLVRVRSLLHMLEQALGQNDLLPALEAALRP